MRLERLEIPKYRNLSGFEFELDEVEPISVLLGQNGTGKSNLIEVIVEIFRHLDQDEPAPFSYRMIYFCHENHIEIDADLKKTRNRMMFSVDGKRISQKSFRSNKEEYLPNYVFAYYSGWSGRLEKHFDRPTRKHYDRVLNSPDGEVPFRRLFFCRKDYSQLVLLAFFLAEPVTSQGILSHYLGIERFESALFVLKEPWWGKKASSRASQEQQGDPRFWNARGAFQGFLGRLWKCALAPIRSAESVERDLRRNPETTERLYLFIKDQEQLASLKEETEDTKTLFGYLESLFLCDLIDEVRVTVKRSDGTRIKFVQMSEGEQQLLTVLGLLLFTQNDESLYLLDEPDTHLNPVWSYEMLDLLKQYILVEKGQLLIATHDPVMIGGLHRKQVRLLSREDRTIVATEPDFDPIGIGVEGLLKSELYGLRSTLAPAVLEKIDRHYSLLGKAKKGDEETAELMKLANELNKLAVSRTHPNPYFERFAAAISRRYADESRPILSREEIEARERIADKILEEIYAEENMARGGSAE